MLSTTVCQGQDPVHLGRLGSGWDPDLPETMSRYLVLLIKPSRIPRLYIQLLLKRAPSSGRARAETSSSVKGLHVWTLILYSFESDVVLVVGYRVVSESFSQCTMELLINGCLHQTKNVRRRQFCPELLCRYCHSPPAVTLYIVIRMACRCGVTRISCSSICRLDRMHATLSPTRVNDHLFIHSFVYFCHQKP